MLRLRFLALPLAALVLIAPIEQDGAWAERSDPNYGRPSTSFKRSGPARSKRKIRKVRPSQTVAQPPKPAAETTDQAPPSSAPLPSPNPEKPAGQPPVPTAKPISPEPAPAVAPPPAAAAPVPAPKPEAEKDDVAQPPPAAAVPIPVPKPPEAGESEPPAEVEQKEEALPVEIPPHPATTPAEELACRARLKGLGAQFSDQPPQSDPSGCSLPSPLLLTRISPTIGFEPGALMNCATAEATVRFAQGPMAAAARSVMGEELTSIQQASAYVCRPRHNSRKLSEHAFGNAIDFSRFTFSKGAVVEIGPVPGGKGETFLNTVRAAACGPFKTVLGPGSDADHATHLHLDLAHRRNGGTFCQ